MEFWRSKALEDPAKKVLEELDPNLNYFLLLDHDHPLHDSILGFLWDYYQVFCDPVLARAQGYSPI